MALVASGQAHGLMLSSCDRTAGACFAPLNEEVPLITEVAASLDAAGADAECVKQLGANWKWSLSSAPNGAKKSIACMRRSYDASPISCCLNRAAGWGQTCDPQYTAGTEICDELMKPYCSLSGRFFSDAGCQAWAKLKPADAEISRSTYCASPAGQADANCNPAVASTTQSVPSTVQSVAPANIVTLAPAANTTTDTPTQVAAPADTAPANNSAIQGAFAETDEAAKNTTAPTIASKSLTSSELSPSDGGDNFWLIVGGVFLVIIILGAAAAAMSGSSKPASVMGYPAGTPGLPPAWPPG